MAQILPVNDSNFATPRCHGFCRAMSRILPVQVLKFRFLQANSNHQAAPQWSFLCPSPDSSEPISLCVSEGIDGDKYIWW